MSPWTITQEPGTCGGCKHFSRHVDRYGKLMASGKCLAKPYTRLYCQQRERGCKRRYEPKEGANMDIQDAIQHCREVAEGCPAGDRDCAYQHDQLIDWLEELEAYRATETPFSPGGECWVVERDEDGAAYEISGYIFVAQIPGYTIVTPSLNGHDELDYIMADHVEQTAQIGHGWLAVYPESDTYATREEAQAALEQGEET